MSLSSSVIVPNQPVFVAQASLKRLVNDIKQIIKNSRKIKG